MTLSIIIPVYNVKHDYLRKCLQSLISQDFDEDYEIIVVDDGSTNRCGEVARSFAAKKSKVRLIIQENKGTSVARNTGLDAATGEFIIFVDADDFVSPGLFQKVIPEIREKEVDILFFGYKTSYENREVVRVLESNLDDPELWNSDALELAVLQGDKRLGPVDVGAPWGKVIRRDLIEKNGIRYTEGLIKGQDTVFSLELFEYADSFAYLAFPGYHYRVSNVSVSHRYNPDIVEIMEKTLGAYRDFCVRHEKDASFFEAVDRKYLKVLMGEYLELYFLHKENPEYGTDKMIRAFISLIRRLPYREIIHGPEKISGVDQWTFFLLRTGRVRVLFDTKKMEMFLRGMVVRKYG